MLPSLLLSSSSLDQFRKNVYRPRLCLLLLLVLLSPYNASQLTSSPAEAVSFSQPAQQGWSVSIIDGLVVAAPPPASKLLESVSSALPKKLKTEEADAKTGTSESKASSPSPAPSVPKNKASKETSAQEGQPSPGSLFRLPKLSWGLVVDEHVLPALLPLHLLWAIRLGGMAVEDGVVKSSLLGAKSSFHSVTLPLIYLGVLSILAILAGQPGTVSAISSLCHDWRIQLGFEPLQQDKDGGTSFNSSLKADGLLPLSLFVMLEAASTVVHLSSVLTKVDAELISRIVPMQMKLPSPSHLPPLVELLPLPRVVKAALTEPLANTATARYARGRRPMMPSVNPAPPSAPTNDGHAAAQAPQQEQTQAQPTANTTAVNTTQPTPAAAPTTTDDLIPQQVYRRVGAPDSEILRTTSVARPIAPLRLPESEMMPTIPASDPFPLSASHRLRGQSVLVSTKWISDTATSLFDKLIGTLLYAIITLRLPTLSPTSLPPVLSLLSLRSELASLTQIWSRARSSVECLEFVRRRWGVVLEEGKDPYTSVPRPRAAKEAGDYKWKSCDDVFCAICFELTRSKAMEGEGEEKEGEKEGRKYEFCRLDCGHELHDVCLVSWLTAQAFCPTCHVVLSFSPRSSSRRSAAQT
ncbi:hypothetical protein NDA13_002448 [Ustilago tritici]|nr:hypothetical protein NDA13_002448 [Ustilago tritici]